MYVMFDNDMLLFCISLVYSRVFAQLGGRAGSITVHRSPFCSQGFLFLDKNPLPGVKDLFSAEN